MTFNPVAAINVIECKSLVNNTLPKAIDLGSQTASINEIFIKNLFTQNKVLANLTKFSELENFTTKVYFKITAFNEHKSN
tara:strand:+ start:901 stop:1140 length:240 start_codon:yes stop_codon:yes gene_type:complete